MPLTTIDALLERMVTATENLLTRIPEKLNDYLPLAGGKMTGTITTSNLEMLRGSDTDKQYFISGGTPHDKGAEIFLNGVDRTVEPGTFQLVARDNGVIKSFKGKPDGTLTWDDHPIALTDSLFTTVSVTVTGDINANTWGDLDGTITYTTGYTKVVGVLGIMVSSPANMMIVGWEIRNNNTAVRVRCRSVNALTDASADVTLMLAK